MSIADIRIGVIIEEAANAATDDEGHFEQKTLVDEIRARLKAEKLTPDIKAQVELDQAANYATRFVNRRKPKPCAAGTLFHPAYVLPLGDGKRVWMDKATGRDLLAWAALEVKNTAVILAATGRRQDYIGKRLDVLKDHPKWTLGEVERKSFDWVETEEPPDETEEP